MDYSEKERREHIRELQQYLYSISLMIKSIPTVIPDGFFGEKTEKAVIAFQQEYGLPVTGEVDKKTWDTVIVIYKHLFESPPEKIDVFPENDFVLKEGDTGYLVYVLQIMLKTIGERYTNFPTVSITGTYDSDTAEAIRYMQNISLFPDTGATDKYTWNNIVKTFEHAVKYS
jgi:peptidoglycan hydrolase-like protein with peptidoglycan-binding domain